MLDVLVVTTGHDVADARLHRIVAALDRQDLRIGLHGLGSPSGAPDVAHLRSHPRPRLARRGLAAASLPAVHPAARVLVVLDPELVLSALVWRTLRRGRVVVDVHEDYVALLRDREWARGLRRLIAASLARSATAMAGRADLTVVADAHVPPSRARRRVVVRNVAPRVDLPAAGRRDPTPRALYVGDLRTSRGLRRMVDAIVTVPPWRLDLVGPIAASDEAWLAAALRRPGGERIQVHGRLPPMPSWEFARGAWVGLSVLDQTSAFVDALPTKVYEYLGCGLAVVSTPLPRVAALLRESGGGVVIGSVEELAHTLRRWSDQPESVDEYRSAARAWAAASLPTTSEFDVLAAATAALVKGRHPRAGSRDGQRRRGSARPDR